MQLKRREFIGTASALVAGMATSRIARAQEAGGKPPNIQGCGATIQPFNQ